MSGYVVNPEAVGDPEQAPRVYLGEEAGQALGIRQRPDEPDADPAPAAWPDRTHDGQRMRDTETADVAGEVL